MVGHCASVCVVTGVTDTHERCVVRRVSGTVVLILELRGHGYLLDNANILIARRDDAVGGSSVRGNGGQCLSESLDESEATMLDYLELCSVHGVLGIKLRTVKAHIGSIALGEEGCDWDCCVVIPRFHLWAVEEKDVDCEVIAITVVV